MDNEIMDIQFLDEPISKYTNPKILTMDYGLSVQEAAEAMVKAKTDSILAYTNYVVIGIVTIRDMLNEVLAKGKDPTKVTIGEIVKRPIIKIQKDAKVKEAIQLMKKHDVRRLVVWNDEIPIGLISQKIIVGNMNDYAIELPELESINQIKCPYCLSHFDNKITLSSHIDGIHIGKGLLEGNLAKT